MAPLHHPGLTLALHLVEDIPYSQDDESQRDQAEQCRHAREAPDSSSRRGCYRVSDDQRGEKKHNQHDYHDRYKDANSTCHIGLPPFALYSYPRPSRMGRF